MALSYPFSITKRKDSPYFYVRFKNETTGKYIPWKSTGQTDKQKAIKTALQWFTNGKKKSETVEKVETLSFRDTVRKADITPQEIDFILAQWKHKGLLKNYVVTGSRKDINAYDFMLTFWTWEKSEYIAEKLRKNHGIGKRHVSKQYSNIKNHWYDIVKNKTLSEITKQDINRFMKKLAEKNLSHGAKNDIVRAGTTALKWAFNNDLINRDITAGLVFFSGHYKERQILTPEIVQALFSVPWNDERCKLANMLAMCTGLRAGEIQGLRLQDLGKDCLYIRHSWNLQDGLKCTKNRENRIAEMPFPMISQALKDLAETNPYGAGMNGYVFYASIPDKPMESKTFLHELRQALLKMGMTKETAKGYTFHAWRHFFTAYMADRVNNKVLQQQTGHKTTAMLEHYAEHRIDGEREGLRLAQVETFGSVINTSPVIIFNTQKIMDYVRG